MVVVGGGSFGDLTNACLQVGSGYTKKQLAEFNQRLAEHWRPFDKRQPPHCILLASGFKEKPDAWIPPDKSCIVQVGSARGEA